MKRICKVLIALCLAACLLFTGCGMVNFGGFFDRLLGMVSGPVAFSDMEYVRPDMDAYQKALDAVLKEAAEQKNLNKLVTAIYDFYAEYDAFYTGYALSNIHYSKDLRDTYWEEEYNFCMENTAQVDAGIDSLYRALAQSPLREELEGEDYFGEGFFDKYEGESLYDDYFKGLLTQEAQLEAQYYALSGEDAYDRDGLETLYIDLVRVRQDMAEYAGYESYPEFAYEFTYGRDYTPAQAMAYLDNIQKELVPMYEQMMVNTGWVAGLQPATEQEMHNYMWAVTNAMGGQVQEAFSTMTANGLCDTAYSEYKANTSFEIFIRSYYTPYVFLNPTGTTMDYLTFAHEFGHFCADYFSMGSGAGVDVAEVFSQGMEYMSLCYADDRSLETLKLATSIATYVEQSAYASFELQVYGLEDEALTTENVQKLFEDTLAAYGMNTADSLIYADIPHLYIAPMYVISYTVSNDMALQFYILEQEETGAGAAKLMESITTMQTGIQAFAQEAGLTSPFADGWIQTVKETLEKVFAP